MRLLDVIANVESCSNSEARRLLPAVTLDGSRPDPVPNGFYLYQRGKKTFWWVLMDDGGMSVRDPSAGNLGLLLGEFAPNGITPRLRTAAEALMRGQPSEIAAQASARLHAEIARRRAEERSHVRS